MGSRYWTAALSAALLCVAGFAVTVGLVIVSPGEAQAQARNYDLNYYGGHCRICSGQTYACSNGHGSWSSGQRSFRDPIPSGYKVTRINFQTEGVFGCSGRTSYWYNYLNGYNWGTAGRSGHCSCNGCNGWGSRQTPYYSNGLPGYRYRTTNYFQLRWYRGLGCVSRVRMYMEYRRNLRTCYRDADGDGYGNRYSSSLRSSCSGGWVTNSSDCNDGNRNIRPGAREVCNGVDDDCDGSRDEGLYRYYYYDVDNDSYGQSGRRTYRCNATGYYRATRGGDCNDSNRNIRPGAREVCNNIDDDCDGTRDEGAGGRNWYYDADGDGYGTNTRIYQCRASGYYRATRNGDCDDRRSYVNPGRPEICGNGLDDNCAGGVDENMRTFYEDRDRDGWGNRNRSRRACSQPSGYVTRTHDCDDGRNYKYPGRTETCDGHDNDCDGQVDENLKVYRYLDADRDGYGRAAGSYSFRTGQVHFYYNSRGTWTHTNLPNAEGTVRATVYAYGDLRYSYEYLDMRIEGSRFGYAFNSGYRPYYRWTSQTLNIPASTWNTYNRDQRITFYAYPSRYMYRAYVYINFSFTRGASYLVCPNQPGYSTRGGDCDDRYSNVHPGHAEVCGDGRDNNCNGQVDENTRTWYRDADSDGYGNSSNTRRSCAQPSGYIARSGDCNDSNPSINPGRSEVCNGADDNCNNQSDEGLPTRRYYYDADNDSYGEGGGSGQLRVAVVRSRNNYASATPVRNMLHGDRFGVNIQASVVYVSQIDSATELRNWDVVVLGDSGYNEDQFTTTFANALYAWMQNGGGVIATGWVDYSLGGDSVGYAMDRVIPTDVAPHGYSYCYSGHRLYHRNGNHDILSGIPNGQAIAGRYVEYSPLAPDGPSAEIVATASGGRCTTGGTRSAIVTGRLGSGRSVYMGVQYMARQSNYQNQGLHQAGSVWDRLLRNTVKWVGGSGRSIVRCGPTGNYRATRTGDCLDTNNQVHPGHAEVCGNNLDDNCNGTVDENTRTYYRDADGDGYGNSGSTTRTCATRPPNGYVTNSTDCNDGNGNINPGRTEVCNQVDDNCRNGVDEGLPTRRYYLDNDNDRYGTSSYRTVCGPQGNYRATATNDCNDNNRNVNPGHAEVCANNIDDNCNGQTDENTSTFYPDRDGDGYGVTSGGVRRCSNQRPNGYVTRNNDCNDNNRNINPGRTEVCNNVDDDCDGSIDIGGSAQTFTLESDVVTQVDYHGGRGYWHYSSQNNLHSYTYPGIYDITTWMGFNLSQIPDGVSVTSIQMHMTPRSVYNNPAIRFYSSTTNSFNSNYRYNQMPRSRAVSGIYTGFRNGQRRAMTLDHNAFNWTQELSDNRLTIAVDEYYNNAYRYVYWYGRTDHTSLRPRLIIRTNGRSLKVSRFVDTDRDGYGRNATALVCDGTPGYSTNNRDCNDTNPAINPGRAEVCANNIDDNCNGQTDENTSTFYRDVDGDGYGQTNQVRRACTNQRPSGYAVRGGDCADNDAQVNPGATEICNFKDDDCDGRNDIGGSPQTFVLEADVVTQVDYHGYRGYWHYSSQNNLHAYTGSGYDITSWMGFNLSSIPDGVGISRISIDMTPRSVYNNPAIRFYSSTTNGFTSNYRYNQMPRSRAVSGVFTGFSNGRRRTMTLTPSAFNWTQELSDNRLTIGVDEYYNNSTRYVTWYGRTDHSSIRPRLTIVTEGRNLRTTEYLDSDGDGFGSSRTVVSCDGRPGTSNNNRDCNDNNRNVHPNHAEVCGNGLDDNCNGSIDENKVTWYQDADSDNYGNSAVTRQYCADANPSGFVRNATDCNDGNRNINPGADEVCNGIDDNCNGSRDEGLLVNLRRDADGDGFGNPNGTYAVCPGTNGYVTDARDCNDGNRAINPDATEVCGNRVDDNCNGQVDETGRWYYRDADSDGYGNANARTNACTAPNGYVTNNTDCNDSRGDVNPGHRELCDGRDNNCNSQTDEGLNTSRFYYDNDDDTYGLSNNSIVRCGPTGHYTANRGGDCDDTRNTVNPGRAEICGNNIDDNCANGVDENKITFYRDLDGDGHGDANNTTRACTAPNGYVTNSTDCNDNSNVMHPGRQEVCDGLDNDCRNGVDDGLAVRTYHRDEDDDTYGTTQTISRCGPEGHFTATRGGDCDDSTNQVNPGRAEICGNNIDDNCVNGVDENKNRYFRDADNDGFGDPNNSTLACTRPNGYQSNSRDCVDNNGNIHPDAEEICDGIDNNCAGGADEGLDTTRYYFDQDDDTYGLSNNSIVRCGPTGHYTATRGDDCNDNSGAVNPGRAEICGNNIDDNCADGVDENKIRFYEDSDGDEHGNVNSSVLACTQPNGYVSNTTDCDDNRSNVNPDQEEVCDGLDNDCANGVDDGLDTSVWYLDADNDTYGTNANIERCGALGNYRATRAGDCNDNRANINPGVAEICGDEVDNNCNDQVDENKLRFYADADNDSFGDPNNPTDACTRPNGYVTNNNDCDDSTNLRRPNLAEICDGIDNDCNNVVDNGLATTRYYFDGDDDTYGVSSRHIDRCGPTGDYTAQRGGDCDDEVETVNPGRAEICGNNIDDNCADGVDENKLRFYIDDDSDGFGDPNNSTLACTRPNGYVTNSQDCDDTTDRRRPNLSEVCDDLDNDCNGQVDDGLARSRYFHDEDDDTYGLSNSFIDRCGPRGHFTASRGDDCRDDLAAVNPGQAEVCGNGLDDNCNGATDENIITWYRDADEDEYGDPDNSQRACTQPTGFIRNNTDCNDAQSTVFPGNDEICDDLDNDCNGTADDGLETARYYLDADNDTYGTNSSIVRCAARGNFRASRAGDCNDEAPAVNPGQAEICGNGIDDNCADGIDENIITWYRDRDEDEHGNPNDSSQACAQPSGFVRDNTDCNDNESTVFPGNDEICDGLDNDCNGTPDNGLDTRDYFYDEDEDSYGLTARKITRCGPDGLFTALRGGDCADTNEAVNPGVAEICGNDIDDNCDGDVDENALVFYRDGDNDEYGDPNTRITRCTQPEGFVTDSTDCDDRRDNVNPGEQEVCDSLDNDCNGTVDDDLLVRAFRDTDEDGYGTSEAMVCPGTRFFAGTAGDCNDGNAEINPAAEEICDSVDNNCNGETDEGLLVRQWRDDDRDTYGQTGDGVLACPGRSGFVARSGDCNDGSAITYPGANEICDQADNDCDEQIDEGPRGGNVCGSEDPVLQQLDDITTSTDQCDGVAVSLPTPQVADDNDPNPTVSNNAPDVFPVGRTTVRWQAVDRDQNVGTMGHIVTVNFTGRPEITAPNGVTMEADNPGGTVVNLGNAQASICIPGAVTVTNNAPSRFPVGTHTVTWTAAHQNAPSNTATQTVVITDRTAPNVNAGRDRVFVDPQEIVIASPTVSDNGTPTNEIDCSHDAPQNYEENRWTTVTWTCVDNNGNRGTDSVRIYRQVGDTPPPTITLESPARSGWITDEFTYRAVIDDPSCTDEPNVLFQGALTANLTRASENQWILESDVVAPGGYSTNLIVTSACGQNLTASHAVNFGYDPIAPAVTFVGPSQRGVDENDVNTWPATANRGVLATLVRAQDAHSGVVTINTTIEAVDSDAIALDSYTVDPLLQTLPPQGSRFVTTYQCANEDHCTQDEKLRLSSLVGRNFILTFTVSDEAGNVTTDEHFFRVFDFRSSVVAWRDAVVIARSDVPGAQAALDEMAQLLGTALDMYDNELWGNMLLALEDAVAKINVARAHDERVSNFNNQVLLTASLAIDFWDGLYSESRAQNINDDNHGIYSEADRRVAEARQALDQDDAGAVYLALANVWFFTVDAERPREAVNTEQARLVMSNMIPEVGRYLDLDGNIPGQENLIAAYEAFQNAEGYFAQIVLNGDTSVSDLVHMQFLLDMTTVAENLKDSENDGAWVRNWQWGVTHVTYLMARRALHNAGTWLGPNHPIIQLGNQQLEAARILREQKRPDDFMRIVIDSRCLTAGLYNLVYDPDVEVIEQCCEAMVELNELDNNVPVPDHCIE